MLTMIFVLAIAPSALAQEDGVTLDPGAPSAKEYALPLESARRDLSGAGDAPVRQGARGAPMFGEGVSREGEGGRATTPRHAAQRGTSAESKGSDDATAAAASGSGDGGSGAEGSADRAAPGDPDDDLSLSSTGALLGGGGLVLVLAVLGGIALRAVRAPDRHTAP